MDDLSPLESELCAAWPPGSWRDFTVILAVSGGADSVALLRAAARLKAGQGRGRLVVAHYDHALRGSSDEDARFVEALAGEVGLSCRVERFSGDWDARDAAREGLESAARELRYAFFRRTAEAVGARLVATAHTADDQAETLLHRIARGTGVAGLAGIPRTRLLVPGISLMRPMLGVRRAQVLDYLRGLGQPFREDDSNTDLRFTRNRSRHELIPLLVDRIDAAAVDAILRLRESAAETQAHIDAQVAELHDAAVAWEAPGRVRVRRDTLIDAPELIARELLIAIWRSAEWPLRAMGRREWVEMAAMLRATSSEGTTRMFPGAVTAVVDELGLVLHRETPKRGKTSSEGRG